jgi:hypothetical protein
MTPPPPTSTFKPFKSFKTLAGLSDGLNYLNPAKPFVCALYG